MGIIKGDTRSLDYGSYAFMFGGSQGALASTPFGGDQEIPVRP